MAGLGIDPEIAEVCRSAARGLEIGGADVEQIEVDLSEARKAFLHLRGVWMVTHMPVSYTHLTLPTILLV